MSSVATAPARARTATQVRELQGRITRMQAPRLDSRALPTAAPLASLLPGGALKAGASYSVIGSTSLAMALMAGPSSAGAWCAVVGVPSFGVEAAAAAGIDLERLVLVPKPGKLWLTVTAAMADVAGVLIASSPGQIAPSDAARLSARLRQREATLIVLGQWPQSEATLRVASSRWKGLGPGHGYLEERELTVIATSQGIGRPRSASIRLSSGSGVAASAESTAEERSTAENTTAKNGPETTSTDLHAVPLRKVANL